MKGQTNTFSYIYLMMGLFRRRVGSLVQDGAETPPAKPELPKISSECAIRSQSSEPKGLP